MYRVVQSHIVSRGFEAKLAGVYIINSGGNTAEEASDRGTTSLILDLAQRVSARVVLYLTTMVTFTTWLDSREWRYEEVCYGYIGVVSSKKQERVLITKRRIHKSKIPHTTPSINTSLSIQSISRHPKHPPSHQPLHQIQTHT